MLLGSSFSPFPQYFQYIFQLKESNYTIICEIRLFELLFHQYVEVRISRSVLEGPFDFEITRVNDIITCLTEALASVVISFLVSSSATLTFDRFLVQLCYVTIGR